MRTAARVMFTASVWARIVASPSSSSTSDGGMTTPSVLAMHNVATLRSLDTPRASKAGATLRDSVYRLAPTEPFIGASRAPTPSAASSGAAALRASSRLPARCRLPASGRRFSNAPTSAYRGSACSRSCSSSPTRRNGSTPSSPLSNAPVATPSAANSAATASSTA